ncbi:MAG: hypothetical protein IT307_05505, partial [Chloroflexi bacterium]|nr:hypothetical protein [Chloroflexota bacterium]
MTINDAILAVIGASGQTGVRGRTLVQKKLYFLSVLMAEDFGFTSHFYGPYSSLVAQQLGALVAAGFVTEEVGLLGRGGRFAEARRYTYRLTEAGAEVQPSPDSASDGWFAAIERVNDHRISDDVDKLSIAA